MPEQSHPKPAGRGCLFYGCLSLVVLVLVLLLTGYLTARYVVNTAIENYTDASLPQFEAVTISASDRDDLRKRVAEFNAAKGKTNEPVQLSLTGTEINALIAEDAALKDRVRVGIEGDKLTARASLPLEPYSNLPLLSRLKGRHLNASFRVSVAVKNGAAEISLVSAEVNGAEISQAILESLEKEDSFQKTLNNPDIRKKLNQLDWIRIEDGRLEIATGGSKAASN